MNGDIARLEARIDGVRKDNSDAIRVLLAKVNGLEVRLNQEESDREHADTALQDSIDRVEREQS